MYENALLACLAGLFVLWEALSSLLLQLEVGIQFLSHVFDFLLTVFIIVLWHTGPKILLPLHPSLILRLPRVLVVFLRPTDVVVLTPVVKTQGHLAVEGLVMLPAAIKGLSAS